MQRLGKAAPRMRRKCQQVGYKYQAGVEPVPEICGMLAVGCIGELWYCADHFDKWIELIKWVKIMRGERAAQ